MKLNKDVRINKNVTNYLSSTKKWNRNKSLFQENINFRKDFKHKLTGGVVRAPC